MKTSHVLIVLAAVAALSGALVGAADEPAPPTVTFEHDFTLPDQAGNNVTLSSFAGKIIVLEWVNPDCPFVKAHYKHGTMKALARKYAPKGVVWLAINTTRNYTTEMNRAFHTAHGLPYPVLNDQAGTVGHAYGAKSTPHMFLLDATGKLVYEGAIDDDPMCRKAAADKPVVNYVDVALAELLAGKPVTLPHTKPYGCSVKYAK